LWVNLTSPTEQEFAWLAATFGFHPLTIEDCRHRDQRPKLEVYDNYLFITLHAPKEGIRPFETDELHVFLSPNYLVTVCELPVAFVESLLAEYRSTPRDFDRGLDFVFYRLSDQAIDRYFPVLDDLGDEIDQLEDQIIERPTQDVLNRIFALKQELVLMRKVSSPQREVFNALTIRGYTMITESTMLYFRNVYDHLVRVYDMIDSYRDLMSNALDAYLSTISNRLNEVMKRLTIIATIFMPLSFVAGFFGMNFTRLPFESLPLLIAALLVMAAIPSLMLLWFYRSGWM
jgi:magnesium transporter